MLSGVKFIPRHEIEKATSHGKTREKSFGRDEQEGVSIPRDLVTNDDVVSSSKSKEVTRKEMGLDWMLKPTGKLDECCRLVGEAQSREVHPRDCNPCFNDEETTGGEEESAPTGRVGDGGASWRLKALKRAREQAAREGRSLGEVVGERWGSLDQLAISEASQMAAPSRAHLLAIKNRQRGITEKNTQHHLDLRAPKNPDSWPWRKQKWQNTASAKDEKLMKKELATVKGNHRSHELVPNDDDDGDDHVARMIIQNRQYSLSGQAEDEYDYYDGQEMEKARKKKCAIGRDEIAPGKEKVLRRIRTQQERCLFCFDNPNRPMHLVVSIANFTYLMLPRWQPVARGHCCVLPMQHESATRSVDNGVWEEIRNFKKCLIMMFAKQEKEVVFLETVMGLAQQRRHCLIECVPLPRDIAKQAPLFFKKAIDEAEEEWSQHNAKKLIDTTEKGLRGSIPKNFPYFHVEFGLDRGFVHVIDDERQFKSSLGLNVMRGMLQSPEEDMYRRRKFDSVETQKLAVAAFVRDWQHFDWTKQLD